VASIKQYGPIWGEMVVLGVVWGAFQCVMGLFAMFYGPWGVSSTPNKLYNSHLTVGGVCRTLFSGN
jgi:hypothetical protein